MNAYADHNFLITCANRREWRDVLVDARARNQNLVFSPWHFYEYGQANPEQRKRLVEFAEEVQPAWILERADLQLAEFVHHWDTIWGDHPGPLQPIGPLSNAAAALHGVAPERLRGATLAQYADIFAAVSDKDGLWQTLDNQTAVSASNRAAARAGRLTKAAMKAIDMHHAATQIARATGRDDKSVYAESLRILSRQPVATQVEWFVEWGCMQLLRSYQVESVFTHQFYDGEATLGRNRYVDRTHACAGLPYCDGFVTDDADLIKRCRAAQHMLKFETAEVLRAEEFLARLS